MIDDHDLFERAVERFAPPEGSFERLATRRDRKHRNKRITAGVLALVVAAAGTAALIRAFPSGSVPADDDAFAPFLGEWTTAAPAGDVRTMTIRASEGEAVRVVAEGTDSAGCSAPSMLRGVGQLEDATALVVSSPVLTCADGPSPELDRYTLILDAATDRLFDDLEAAWYRGSAPVNRADTTETQTGSGPMSFLDGEVTFRASPPWAIHPEAYLDWRLFFMTGPGDAWIEIFANPILTETPCTAVPGAPASAEELVGAVRSNPDLETTVPVTERLGGVDALRLDVDPVRGATICSGGRVPVVSVSGRESWGSVELNRRGRLYVLDLPGGSARALAIWITAPEASFERAVEAAAPVLESFEFHTG